MDIIGGLIILFIVALVIGLIVAGIQIAVMKIGFVRAMLDAANKFYGTTRIKVGRILLIVSGLGLMIALCTTLYTWHFTSVARHARGTVIGTREHTDRDGLVVYAPTVRFQDSAGVQHTVSSSFFQAPPAFHIGESVPVLYLGDDPQTAHLDGFWEIWVPPIVLGIFSTIFLGISLSFICCRQLF